MGCDRAWALSDYSKRVLGEPLLQIIRVRGLEFMPILLPRPTKYGSGLAAYRPSRVKVGVCLS